MTRIKWRDKARATQRGRDVTLWIDTTMMSFLFTFILLIACSHGVPLEYFYDKSEYVQEVKTVDHFKKLYNSEHTVVIEFYAHWCGHCKQFTAEYEKTAKHLNNIMYFAAVNCGDEEAAVKAGNPETKARQMICSNFKVESMNFD